MGDEIPTSPEKAVEDYKFPIKRDSGRHGFSDLPVEIRNRIYEHCAGHIVDIVKTKCHPLLEVHKAISNECVNWLYSENVFLLDARATWTRWGADHLSSYQNWSSQQDPQCANMIQHLRIATPAFEANIHIPRDDNTQPVTVTFEHEKPECLTQLTVQIIIFYTRLMNFNHTRAGQHLTIRDLDLLVAGMLWVVPFCCLRAADEGRFLGRCRIQVEKEGDLCLKFRTLDCRPKEPGLDSEELDLGSEEVIEWDGFPEFGLGPNAAC